MKIEDFNNTQASLFHKIILMEVTKSLWNRKR